MYIGVRPMAVEVAEVAEVVEVDARPLVFEEEDVRGWAALEEEEEEAEEEKAEEEKDFMEELSK